MVRPRREDLASESQELAASAASTGEVHRQASASIAASRRRDSGSPAETATKQAANAKMVRLRSLTHPRPDLQARNASSPRTVLPQIPATRVAHCGRNTAYSCHGLTSHAKGSLQAVNCRVAEVLWWRLQDQERQLAALLSLPDLSNASLAEAQGSSNLIYILKTLQVRIIP